VLSLAGIYAVMSFAVSRRTREVGIRMALGAERRTVLRLILAQGGRLALTGVVLGAIASIGVGRLLESLLYGVSGFDPIAYGAAVAVLFVGALMANLIPALAASRVDPVRALRSE
jgi:putative ABC transport system permease protein